MQISPDFFVVGRANLSGLRNVAGLIVGVFLHGVGHFP